MPGIIAEPISHRTYIRTSPKRVYDTITTADGWDSFFTKGMKLDLRAGGEMLFSWKDWGPDNVTAKGAGIVLRFAEPDQFVFQWYPVSKDHPTTVEINILASGDDTIVDLKEYGYPDTEAGRVQILDCACGWGEALTLLKFYLEHGLVYEK